jgi:hypothetical protein
MGDCGKMGKARSDALKYNKQKRGHLSATPPSCEQVYKAVRPGW